MTRKPARAKGGACFINLRWRAVRHFYFDWGRQNPGAVTTRSGAAMSHPCARATRLIGDFDRHDDRATSATQLHVDGNHSSHTRAALLTGPRPQIHISDGVGRRQSARSVRLVRKVRHASYLAATLATNMSYCRRRRRQPAHRHRARRGSTVMSEVALSSRACVVVNMLSTAWCGPEAHSNCACPHSSSCTCCEGVRRATVPGPHRSVTRYQDTCARRLAGGNRQ